VATAPVTDLRVLVVDHHDSYTYNLVHLVASVTGRLPDVVQHDDDRADRMWRDGYTHIVLSPGPGTVADRHDFAVGREIIAVAEQPVLGVCLGMQGMVHTLGGDVTVIEPAHGEVARIEHVGSGVFAGLPDSFRAVRYHSQAAVRVPAELVETAWCDDGGRRVVMGVQHVSRPLHGVQFHPESILTEHGAALMRNFLGVAEAVTRP
jgi:anthranilate synthase/aminodeoxychorismate synthase-like glutamine amidotransferase